jgi:hypothetical protein
MVNRCTGELTPNVAKVRSQRLNFFRNLIDSQNLNAILKNCNHLVAIVIEEEDLVNNFLVRRTIETFA